MNERPRCANLRCNNDGWIAVGELFYCSECVMRFDKKQKEKWKNEMEDL